MANTKISALTAIGQEGRGLHSVIPIVDSGNTATNKIDLLGLFGNNPDYVSPENLNQRNFIASCGTNINNPSANEIGFRGSASGNTILSSSAYIENSTNSLIAGTIAGGGSTRINNGSQMVILGSFRSYTDGGERSAIIACEDASIQNAYNGFMGGCSGGQLNQGPSASIGSQGGTINNSRGVMVGSEACTINSNMSGVYNSYATTTQGNLYQVAIGTYQGSFDGLGGAAENMIHLGTRDSDIDHQRASMISTSGRTSQYSGTTHVDNLYSFGRVQTATEVSTTISNEQFLTGGLGMVQYTDVSAGNLNLKINGVRNGEVYHWVIDNQTGGSVSINSVATDTGFTITDNSATSLTTGPHIFTIVVVNNLIIIEGTH